MNFQPVSTKNLRSVIMSLESNKASLEGDISSKLLKEYVDIYVDKLRSIFNEGCTSGIFPDSLKMSEVSPLFKAKDKVLKENYRPISKLPSLSKVYERLIYSQIIGFMENKLSSRLSGFRKGYSSQHALLSVISTIRSSLDKKENVAALLLDLSKAFDCINHRLLIAKLHAYGFSKNALSFVWSYLSDRCQRVGIDGSFSLWQDILDGVPQGSILGPLLFNIYINDFLFEQEHWPNCPNVNLCNYADDNTFIASGESIEIVTAKLENAFSLATAWFRDNGLQLNADKCKFIVFGKPDSQAKHFIYLNGVKLEDTDSVKLLGVTLDSQLTFFEHITGICKRASSKVYALKRISKFLSASQRNVLASSFIVSEFGYCPLIWGFSNRSLIAKINRIIDRSGYSQCDTSSYDIHRKHCNSLLKEIYKTKTGLNPAYMREVFPFRGDTGHSLRSGDTLQRNRIRTTHNGLQTVSYIGAQLWDNLSHQVKSAPDLKDFCKGLESTHNLNCKCRICACYLKNVGFIS